MKRKKFNCTSFFCKFKIIISISILLFVIYSCSIFGGLGKGKIHFCENIRQGKCVAESNVFKTGRVAILVKFSKRVESSSILETIIEDENTGEVAWSKQDTYKSLTSYGDDMVDNLNFPIEGKFKVIIRNLDDENKEIAKGEIEIRND